MSITLEQLIKNRQDLIEAHRKNNFTDGIHALLTDLYPDTAHFIYELLQNAEDMKANRNFLEGIIKYGTPLIGGALLLGAVILGVNVKGTKLPTINGKK